MQEAINTQEPIELEKPVVEEEPKKEEGEATIPVIEPKKPEEGEVVVPVTVEDIVSGAKSKTPKSIQTRIDQLTREKYELRRELEVEKQRKAEAAVNITSSPAVSPNRPLPPDRLDFEDKKDYIEARVKYEDSLESWRTDRQVVSKRISEIQLEEALKIEKFKVDAERVKVNYPDFDEAIEKMPSSPDLSSVVLSSDYAPEIGYYLSQNPNFTIKLMEMDRGSIGREIGKLEARFGDAKTKFISSAPKPITIVEGDAASEKDMDNMSINDWMEADKKREIAKIKKRLGG